MSFGMIIKKKKKFGKKRNSVIGYRKFHSLHKIRKFLYRHWRRC